MPMTTHLGETVTMRTIGEVTRSPLTPTGTDHRPVTYHNRAFACSYTRFQRPGGTSACRCAIMRGTTDLGPPVPVAEPGSEDGARLEVGLEQPDAWQRQFPVPGPTCPTMNPIRRFSESGSLGPPGTGRRQPSPDRRQRGRGTTTRTTRYPAIASIPGRPGGCGAAAGPTQAASRHVDRARSRRAGWRQGGPDRSPARGAESAQVSGCGGRRGARPSRSRR